MTNARLSQRLRASARRANYLVQAAVLSVTAAVPIITNVGRAHGSPLQARSIDMSAGGTSEGSGRDGGDAFGQDVTYTVTFTVPTAHSNIEGLVIEFCDAASGPIIDTACTGPVGFNLNVGSLALANNAEINTLTIHGNSDANTLILSNSTGNALAGSATVSFDLGTSAAANGITNPTGAGTFYARIATYTDNTEAEAYDDEDPQTYIDDGGIALAVANELTISARVQEQLQFCVGTTDAATNDDCTDISGTAINLGVVDADAATESADNAGLAMVRTNAFGGVVISYKAEQNTNSGALKVAGATCSGASETDQCFNSAGTTQTAFVVGTEMFGMTLTDIDTTNGTTTNVACDAEYDADGDCDGTPGSYAYAWLDDGNFDTIASSAAAPVKVVNDEMLNMKFGALADATTPTGLYSVTANFVATATF